MQVDGLMKGSRELDPEQIIKLGQRNSAMYIQDPSVNKNQDQFTAYIHLAGTIAEEPIPPLLYHATCTSNENIYIIGGVTTLYTNHNPTEIDISKFKVIPVHLPHPLSSKIINSPCVVPNYECWTVSSQTHVARKFKPSGDIPPPLLSMSASLLTDRYCFYYGGFELISEVSKNTDGQYVIQNSTKLNNTSYILDLQTFQFKKYELVAHPSFTVRTPITVPRFGHSATAVTIQKKSDTEKQAATIYVMGGYKASNTEPQEYQAIKDLWKLEVGITFRGIHGYLEFSKDIIATPLSLAGEIGPSARAFHVANLFDVESVLGKNKAKAFMTEGEKLRQQPTPPTTQEDSSNSSSPDDLRNLLKRSHPFQTKSTPIPRNSLNVNMQKPNKNNNKESKESSTNLGKSAPVSNLKLLIHGGTDSVNIYGDVWWFDLDSETWHLMETFFNVYDSNYKLNDNEVQPSIVKKCGHVSFIFDCFLMLIVGCIPNDFTNIEFEHTSRKSPQDISELFRKLKLEDMKDPKFHYNRYFTLDLKTATWSIYKCFHEYQAKVPGSGLQISDISVLGGTAVLSNSRVYYCGGFFLSSLDYDEKHVVDVLNNCIEIIDFPLSCFSASEYLKTVTYSKP